MVSIADRLAVTRTALANERTLLAYARTGLALMAGGVGLAQLIHDPDLVLLGWSLVPAGALVFIAGVVRFRQTRRALDALKRGEG